MECFENFGVMNGWQIGLTLTDMILFALYFVSIIYLFAFAFLSLFNRNRRYKESSKYNKFLVIFPIYGNSQSIINSVKTFFEQQYPKEFYDVVVITHSSFTEVNPTLTELGAKLIMMGSEKYTKGEAIKYCMTQFEPNAYQNVVIMAYNNTTDNTFLTLINNAIYAGNRAIQTHRKAKKLDTDTAIFEAVSEEINNSIFRRGHINIGLSSALAGSGIVLEFEWLRSKDLDNNGFLEKHLETLLLTEHIYIEYLSDVVVYSNDHDNKSEFLNRRQLWLTTQFDNMVDLISKLPKYLFLRNLDYCDKLFQWIIPSRTILIGTLVILSLLIFVFSWALAIKWFGLIILLIISFSIATPDYLIDARFIQAAKTIPYLFIYTIVKLIKKVL